MSHKKFAYLALAIAFVFGMITVQGAGTTGAFSASAPEENTATGNALAVSLSQPGTVFRYEQTLGETEVPFLADTDHIYYPAGVNVDDSGNLWVAETKGGRALQYSGDGTFQLQIGTAGSTWLVDETHLGEPSDIAVDKDGNIWVADRNFMRVVKYDPDGAYLLQVGVSDQSGSDNDHFAYPTGVALDSTSKIYVSDSNNQRIQVFDASGVYSATIGMTGEPGSDDAHFQDPYRIAVDEDDNLYVADSGNHRIQIFEPSGIYSATIGETGVPGSENDHFNMPLGVAVDGARIYIADSGNNRVQIFDRATRSYQATLGTGWGSGNDEFDLPMDVALDSAGNLYIADAENHRVQKFDKNLAYVHTFGTTGEPYLTDGYHYYMPDDVAVDANGNIGILEDWHGQRFIKLDVNGVLQFTIGEPGLWGDDTTHFNNPSAVDFDSQGNIYIADCWNNRVQIFDDKGVYQDTLGTGWGTGNDQFDCPSGVKVDRMGNIIVADAGNQRLQVYDSNHTHLATLGVTGESGSDNKHFNWPTAVDVDSGGNIFVADVWNFRVQKCSWSSNEYNCTTFVGETGVYENDFSHLIPMDLALDSAGRLYVADQWNNRIQVFDSNAAYLTTVGGDWGNETSRMRLPTGVAVDLQGNIFVSDTVNHRIQKFAPGVPDWDQVNINGFGDLQNMSVLSLASFNGQLYAGTLNFSGSGAQLWRTGDSLTWTSVITDGFGDSYNAGVNHLLEYNDYLYAGTVADEANGGEVWRSNNGLDWTRVVSQGFGDPTNGEVYRFATFNDQLYASTWSYTDTHGTELWRTSTGNTSDWTRVVENGFNDDASNTVALSLEVFNGSLYAGTRNLTTGGEVWRSNNGTVWNQVNVDGFGAENNLGVSALASFEGYLYAATRGTPDVAGDEVWRCQVCDGSDWAKVVNNGFGNIETKDSLALEVLDNYLYLVAGNESTGVEVWRTDNGTSWQQIGFGGFGDSNNLKPYWDNSISLFNNRLYIGTINWANGGEIWRFDLKGGSIYLPMIQR